MKGRMVLGLFPLFLVALFILLLSKKDLVASADMSAQMNSADGSSSYQFQNSAGGIVGQVDSRGNALFFGTAAVFGPYMMAPAFISTGPSSFQGLTVTSSQTIIGLGLTASALNSTGTATFQGQAIILGSATVTGSGGLQVNQGIINDSGGTTRLSIGANNVLTGGANVTSWMNVAGSATVQGINGLQAPVFTFSPSTSMASLYTDANGVIASTSLARFPNLLSTYVPARNVQQACGGACSVTVGFSDIDVIPSVISPSGNLSVRVLERFSNIATANWPDIKLYDGTQGAIVVNMGYQNPNTGNIDSGWTAYNATSVGSQHDWYVIVSFDASGTVTVNELVVLVRPAP